ncbi:UNVERIFIED_CONTAM: hypothetical protein GTU68_043659 [Idotea baltica]|nr:hypothetical protein [Idotea baltica]
MDAPENSSNLPLLAGIEAGGTKYVCAVGHEPEDPLTEVRFPTGEPGDTIAQAVYFFREAIEQYGPINAMGIGTFGPADINPRSPGYGGILTTPKRGWAGFNVVNALRDWMGEPVPIAFETDVNAAAVGEAEFGAAIHKRNVCYITIGTGIGGGFLHDGAPLHGRMHPEVGHMLMPDLEVEYEMPNPGGVCPFHKNCIEGFASGPAIEKRWGAPGHELADDHPAWDLQARYLAHGCVNLTATWSPDIIIIGGGVIQKSGLISKIREHFADLAGDYWGNLPPIEDYIQEPGLGQQAGIVGSLALARRLL